MLLKKIQDTFELIKFSHSIFAMPFALGAMLIAAQGFPSIRLIALIILALVSARTSAMAFNRWLD
ncbi:MAG: 4-hydroxybenzoate octaprenyltransferase, partial [Deltaproteobacteria bacterium]|nr:4-hydroxybenzoate octaprenyltransferase [Deltaproteobacteria bacterium]